MTISSISDTSAQQLWQILAAASQAQTTSEAGVQSVGAGSGAKVDLSEPGKLFSELKQLSESDPDKFKTVMSSIADEIEKTAESSSDENESKMLKSVAERFSKAAESGDLSEALPPGPPPSGPPPTRSAPPSEANGSSTGQIGAYAQAQNAGSDSFSTVLSIISKVLDESTTS